jgi:CheY-like chemotaxis protein
VDPPRSILYVEDDADIAEMYRFGLARAGYEVSIAPDGPRGLAMLRRGGFDLVLLDVMLPGGMDGIAILETIRADPELRSLPVAILSNSDLGRKHHERARQLGILGWLTKSASPPAVVARSLRRWLKQPA